MALKADAERKQKSTLSPAALSPLYNSKVCLAVDSERVTPGFL
eukprot:NODE_17910_length_214_cov_0.955975.p4 GENE.NODE_17910_length_214_cov_0.955975~~NODE_17910_length_214_cov_0.955975.p4  ORF type:complete len:50 (+),score=13.29 NODE_17910_length_214_cov_0.955975:22-150(+)